VIQFGKAWQSLHVVEIVTDMPEAQLVCLSFTTCCIVVIHVNCKHAAPGCEAVIQFGKACVCFCLAKSAYSL